MDLGLSRLQHQHQLAHASRIGIAGHRLHDGTDHSFSGLHLAVADLLENIRLRRERRIDAGDRSSVVREGLQATIALDGLIERSAMLRKSSSQVGE